MHHQLIMQEFGTTVLLQQLVVIILVVNEVIRREFVPHVSSCSLAHWLLWIRCFILQLEGRELSSAYIQLAIFKAFTLLDHVGLVLTAERH